MTTISAMSTTLVSSQSNSGAEAPISQGAVSMPMITNTTQSSQDQFTPTNTFTASTMVNTDTSASSADAGQAPLTEQPNAAANPNLTPQQVQKLLKMLAQAQQKLQKAQAKLQQLQAQLTQAEAQNATTPEEQEEKQQKIQLLTNAISAQEGIIAGCENAIQQINNILNGNDGGS